MFGPKLFNFTNMLSGISKTLNIVNNVIPIYKETKPMVNNVRNALNVLKELGNNTTNRIINKTNEHMKPFKDNNTYDTNLINNKKGPTFFK